MKKVNFKDIIIREGPDYIIINKPPYISSLDERMGEATSIVRLAKEYHPDAQLCHRLDKETSGILVIAKNSAAYRHLSMQFEHREVTKIYHALVEGIHDLKDIAVNAPIAILDKGLVKIDKNKGKEAETGFNTLEVFTGYTLLECMPVTGRLHQIRIHLTFLNAPIAGDIQYGGKELYLSQIKRKFNLKKDTEEEPLMKRVALHAFSIQFIDLEGHEVYTEAEYPKDFAVLVKQLRRYSA